MYFVTYLSSQRELNILCVNYSLYSPYDDDVLIQNGVSWHRPITYTIVYFVCPILHRYSSMLRFDDGRVIPANGHPPQY